MGRFVSEGARVIDPFFGGVMYLQWLHWVCVCALHYRGQNSRSALGCLVIAAGRQNQPPHSKRASIHPSIHPSMNTATLDVDVVLPDYH